MLKAIKVKIYPTSEQRLYMSQLLGCCRAIYNDMLNFDITYYEEHKCSVPKEVYNQHIQDLKNIDRPYLRDVHSKVLQQSLLNLNQAFQNFFKHGSGYPQFKKKKNDQSCRFPKDAFMGIEGNRISLVKQLKNVLFKCSVRDEKYLNKHQDKIHSVTLKKTKSRQYYLSILIDYQPVMKPYIEKAVGLDLGVKSFIITSDAEILENKHFYKSNLKNIKHLQRLHSKKVKGSNNKEKARIKLAKAYEKLTNQKQAYLHEITSKLINENQVICIEDLNVAGMLKNHNLAQTIQEMNFGQFKNMLLYKASMYGRQVIQVDRFYPSSKTCHNCGYINKDLKLSDREWICPVCGQKLDRDYNAAQNILSEGLRILNIE